MLPLAAQNLSLEQKQKAFEHISGFMVPERKEKLEAALKNRTRYVSVMLEDIYQPQNASAVLRSCDAFGVQNVHVVENRNTYRINPDVTMGAHKWLTLRRYKSRTIETDVEFPEAQDPPPGGLSSKYDDRAPVPATENCLKELKAQGYNLVATSPHRSAVSLDALPLDRPLVLLFGTELQGLTPRALELCDTRLKIPMYGFSESFNISVSAALCLYETTKRLRESSVNWALSEAERVNLQLEWVVKAASSGPEILADFLKKE